MKSRDEGQTTSSLRYQLSPGVLVIGLGGPAWGRCHKRNGLTNSGAKVVEWRPCRRPWGFSHGTVDLCCDLWPLLLQCWRLDLKTAFIAFMTRLFAILETPNRSGIIVDDPTCSKHTSKIGSVLELKTSGKIRTPAMAVQNLLLRLIDLKTSRPQG